MIYYLAAGKRANDQLDSAKAWLAEHNPAVMTVLFLLFGVTLVAKGLPPLTG